LSLIHIIVLAVVQGITEFLPISSQAHLLLVDDLFKWPDAGLSIRISAHIGSLIAIILYFKSDIWNIMIGVIHLSLGRTNKNTTLALHLSIASIPVLVAGFIVVSLEIQDSLSSPLFIAWTMIIFGILLWIADQTGMTVRKIEHMRSHNAIVIGVAQIFALIPGTSRSGVTITAARMMGYERTEASKFSMLLGIPTILAAGIWDGYEIWEQGNLSLGIDSIITAIISFITAYISISLMMSWLKHSSFAPFVIYRLLLGGILLYIIYSS